MTERDLAFYKGKRVFVTGHTGFKGAWLCHLLSLMGAEVTGYALMPPTEPSLFELAHLKKGMTSVMGDVRDFDILAFRQVKIEVLLDVAKQIALR